MKIAILGCGAMGSVYAALLGDAGHEVWAIDSWQDHVDAIKKKWTSIRGSIRLSSSQNKRDKRHKRSGSM
jgi:2-dehydropantoate 2-reductase